MTQTAIQNQIIELLPFVENKKILKAIHTILEQEAVMPKLSQAQMDELDRREESYLRGEGKSYTWEEVKSLIRSKSKIV
jgi:putative addiction module component (TIGR02574 family)